MKNCETGSVWDNLSPLDNFEIERNFLLKVKIDFMRGK